LHAILLQKFAEMHSALSEQMCSELSDALEKKADADIATAHLLTQQLVTEASLL